MKNAKELMLEYTAFSFREPKKAAEMFAEDGAFELPYLATFGLPTEYRGRDAIAGFFRSERESDRVGILRGFADSAYSEKFEVADRQALGFEQQVTQVLVAAASIDQHADVAIDGFHYAHADLGPAVVGDA